MRTLMGEELEILQHTDIFKAGQCLKVHNVHCKLALSISRQDWFFLERDFLAVALLGQVILVRKYDFLVNFKYRITQQFLYWKLH